MEAPAEGRIRITQENPDAPVQVEIGASRYKLSEPLDESTRQRLKQIADVLQTWVDSTVTSDLPVREPVQSPLHPEPQKSDIFPDAAQPPPPPFRPRVEPDQVATPALAEEFTEPFWRRLLDAILMRDELPVRPSLDSELADATGEFVEELEGILQERLARRDEPLENDVRFVAGLGGQLQILVGSQAYQSVSDIPDSEVRRVIQEAISEWEGRY